MAYAVYLPLFICTKHDSLAAMKVYADDKDDIEKKLVTGQQYIM